MFRINMHFSLKPFVCHNEMVKKFENLNKKVIAIMKPAYLTGHIYEHFTYTSPIRERG
uniref:Uncharacterized protein n=1 Tax=Arundo donax TaxID=35708 RepID=A0A0A9GLY0_ARUDO